MDEDELVEGQQADVQGTAAQPVQRPPFSQLAIWGFVISCLSLFVFGFIGAMGAALSGRGFRAAAQGRARGKGLALAGMIIGAAGFLFWAIVFIVSRFH
ncbi:DUF4190 domain-containing protein [uncultured Leifsonia sp.]|uniref:DUF4190 domain-containing protein n=1 Tax=uncultured Leifsonia sp. TaxID=340359 RepID=UPI0025CBDEF3|nr:DUF4190 domain-containing protein [uncultured Leifsonia sp.]